MLAKTDKQINYPLQTMRDALLGEIYNQMHVDERIFFLSCDFGAPMLDKLRADFSERFINVGIAEQNLINIATGLALEGFKVFCYAIAPFVTMRAFEQIRNNIAIQGQIRNIDINIIGIGAGLSYDVSGPTHHCIEDISVIRTLPNIDFYSPSDINIAAALFRFSYHLKRPKYFRLDGKPLSIIHDQISEPDLKNGFKKLCKGDHICVIATGYMSHTGLEIAGLLAEENIKISVIDMFCIKPIDEIKLFKAIKNYKLIITLEEGFINNGGLDSLVSQIILRNKMNVIFKNFGFIDKYIFEMGSRKLLHKKNKIDSQSIIKTIKKQII